jgi:sugar phosphate isomerase/epimerase
MNLSRRRFLSGALAFGTALSTSGSPTAAIEPIRRIGPGHLRLSIAAYSYRRYLELGRKTRPEMTMLDFIDTAAAIGCDAVELTSYYFAETTPDYLAALKGRATRLGLDVSGTGVGGSLTIREPARLRAQIANVKRWTEHTSRLGGKTVRVFAGGVEKGEAEEKARQRCIDALGEVCDHAAQYGIFIALENHGGITSTADQVLALVKGVQHNWFGINLDTGNFHSRDPYADLARVAPYAIVVHVKSEMQAFGKKREEADLHRITDLLRTAHFRGYVSLEYEAAEDPRKGVPPVIGKLRKLMG